MIYVECHPERIFAVVENDLASKSKDSYEITILMQINLGS
jgi:hypothetical protein